MKAARRLAVVLAAAAASLLAGAGLAAPAGAHGATGTMGIEVVAGSAPRSADVRVLLEYANDREVVPGATVTVTASHSDGQTVGPIPLADQGQGVYGVTLDLPVSGSWNVTVTSADPVATATDVVFVGTPEELSQPVLQPKDDIVTDSPISDDGPSPAVLAVIAVVLVAGAGVAFTLVRRR